MKLLSFCISLLVFATSFSQYPDRAPLKFNSYAFSLDVSNGEQLVIATRVGEVAIASSIADYWRRADPVQNEKGNFLSQPLFDQANFFNKDTGFVSGFINNGKGSYNIIYHTVNGGKEWKVIDFGEGGWVDDAVNLDNGEAWLSVAGSGIAYSSDYGFTWSLFKIPEKTQRFVAIYFNKNKEGIIGSLWDMIAYTDDNCENWKLLPAPLDQKKYTKTNSTSRPEINRVAIFGDYFLVAQEQLVFYSKKDTIDWVLLPGYSDFYTDATNTNLYFKTNKNNYIKCGSGFKEDFDYKVNVNGYDAKCRNGSLFLICGDSILKLGGDNSKLAYQLLTDKPSSMEPFAFSYTTTGVYGSIGNKIYIQKEIDEDWQFLLTLPFDVSNEGRISMTKDNRILYKKENDSLFYYTIKNETVDKKSGKKAIEDFCSSSITKIIFNKGSQGCFHNYFDELIYGKGGEGYEFEGHSPFGAGHDFVLPSNTDYIDTDIVENFVKNLPSLITKKASIEELGFTDKDYQACKKDILEFQSGIGKKKGNKSRFYISENNIDFNKLLSLVDSIKALDKERLNEILFNLSDLYSTTSLWSKIRLINTEGKELEILNYYYEPNAFNFPWLITLDGNSYYNTAIEINNFIKKVYPAFLDKGSKIDILHTIVRKLYN